MDADSNYIVRVDIGRELSHGAVLYRQSMENYFELPDPNRYMTGSLMQNAYGIFVKTDDGWVNLVDNVLTNKFISVAPNYESTEEWLRLLEE